MKRGSIGPFAGAASALGLSAAPADAGPPRYQILDLTSLAEPLGVVQSEARGINASGQVVGFEALPDFAERGILWDAGGAVQILRRLPGDNSTIAVKVEDDGGILGLSELVELEPCGPFICIFETQKAALWQGETLTDLNDLVTGGDTSFNDRGQIVGGGLRNGQLGRAFLMTPAPCPFDLDADGSVGIADLLELLAAWGEPWGIGDLLGLLAAWGPCG